MAVYTNGMGALPSVSLRPTPRTITVQAAPPAPPPRTWFPPTFQPPPAPAPVTGGPSYYLPPPPAPLPSPLLGPTSAGMTSGPGGGGGAPLPLQNFIPLSKPPPPANLTSAPAPADPKVGAYELTMAPVLLMAAGGAAVVGAGYLAWRMYGKKGRR